MAFKEGRVVESFLAKGQGSRQARVLFRYPCIADAKNAVKMVNGIRDEADFLGMRMHESVSSEKAWLKEQIANMAAEKGIVLFVEVDGVLVGSASIRPVELDVSEHVGNFGIMLKEEFTMLGIGSRLVQKMLELAKKDTRFSIIASSYFSGNGRSRVLHKKFGFKKYGRFPKARKARDGNYGDEILVFKVVK